MFGKYLSIKKTDTLWHYDMISEDDDRSMAHLADEYALLPTESPAGNRSRQERRSPGALAASHPWLYPTRPIYPAGGADRTDWSPDPLGGRNSGRAVQALAGCRA